MNLGWMLLTVVSLMGAMRVEKPTEPVLFVGQPCSCMAAIHADNPTDKEELVEWLAEREYRWVVIFEPVENRELLAGYLIRTQPQAHIVLMEDRVLAAKYRLQFAPDCCRVLEMLEKDREQGWKSGF